MNKNDKHNHHYLPRFYLKYWANEKNKVWVYRLHEATEMRLPNPSLLHIDKVCSEDYLFSIGNDNSVEEWADRKIENHCARSFKKIVSREQLTEDDIFYTKAFLSLTMARHPLMKESSRVISEFLSRGAEVPNPLAQTIHLRMRANMNAFDQLNLQFLYIPTEINAVFITSDVPFFIVADLVKIKLGRRKVDQPVFAYVWFPVSPKTLAFLSKVEKSSVYETITDRTRVDRINLELASCAKDILIADRSNIFENYPNFTIEKHTR